MTNAVVQSEDDDGEMLRQLRDLQRRRDAGEISAEQFTAAYAALDRSVGRPCDACGVPPAAVWRGRRALCGRCALGEA